MIVLTQVIESLNRASAFLCREVVYGQLFTLNYAMTQNRRY